MGKPNAFLLVPKEVDGSDLLMVSRRRFEERDRDGREWLSSDEQGLLGMLCANEKDWPPIAQVARCSHAEYGDLASLCDSKT